MTPRPRGGKLPRFYRAFPLALLCRLLAVWLVAIVAAAEALPACAEGIPLHDGLVSYWALDEGLGSLANDTAPGGDVADFGAVRNSPTWIDGIFDAGLLFNGSSQSVLIPNSADLNLGAAGLTLSAWIKPNVLPGAMSQAYGGIYDSVPDSYVMYFDRGANELRFKVTASNGTAARPAVPASMLDTTQWQHVMGVYDGAGRANIYFNGQLVDSIASGNLVGPVVSGQVATIGADAGVNVGSTSGSARYFFPGAISDVALWNRPLGLAEAQYLYNDGSGSAIGAANPTISPIVPLPPAYKPVLVEAHRGNSTVAPENTLAAIHAAAGSADLVEFDVRVSDDGHLVLMHDGTLNRTTNGSGSVADRNYVGYMDSLDAGSWFGPQFAGEPVPTMVQAVETTFQLGMTPLIERKTGSAAQYVAELTNLGVLDDSVIIAFDWNFLSDVRDLSPNVKLGALGSGSLNSSVIDSAVAAGVDFLDWGDGGSINEATLGLVHAAGLELHVWTVNNMTRMQQLIDLGVDGITTDDPVGLRSLVGWPPEVVAGDFNGDGNVDGADFVIWQTNFPNNSGEATAAMGDANGDGNIDGADFVVWQTNFPTSGAETTPVPEPSGWLLMAGGVVCAWAAIRKSRS